MIDLIFESAEECLTNDEIFLNLENKIVLSIAIRLKAEEIVISQINDPEFVNNISEYQTVLLINKYKELFPNKHSHIELFEQVNLMTPENLHINSFMYEPILDLGDDHLKEVYKKLQNI